MKLGLFKLIETGNQTRNIAVFSITKIRCLDFKPVMVKVKHFLMESRDILVTGQRVVIKYERV